MAVQNEVAKNVEDGASEAPKQTEAQKHKEGPIAKTIESQTAKIPSDVFLWTAVGAIGASLTLQLMKKREVSLFIGQWAPTFLILGLYNKLVKVAGSDRASKSKNLLLH